LEIGNPRELIVETARQVSADLLIMGSHSKRGIFDIALGGTAQRVSRHAPCQVVLVSPQG
jgi:nucleotide-binding universal stress UspA family protein